MDPHWFNFVRLPRAFPPQKCSLLIPPIECVHPRDRQHESRKCLSVLFHLSLTKQSHMMSQIHNIAHGLSCAMPVRRLSTICLIRNNCSLWVCYFDQHLPQLGSHVKISRTRGAKDVDPKQYIWFMRLSCSDQDGMQNMIIKDNFKINIKRNRVQYMWPRKYCNRSHNVYGNWKTFEQWMTAAT
jgi:hypothetical protein